MLNRYTTTQIPGSSKNKHMFMRSNTAPKIKHNTFITDKFKMAQFAKQTELKTIPERPVTNVTNTRSTLSRATRSASSLSSRKGMKNQNTIMDTSIVLDFIADTEKGNNGLQRNITIKPPKTLRKQFFYNTVYDIRENLDPLEMKIRNLEKVYKTKAEDMLWNSPPQTMMKNVLENFARAQPEGNISKYLNSVNENSKTLRNATRSSSGFMRSERGPIRARTIENFFKNEDENDKAEIIRILQTPKANQEISVPIRPNVKQNIDDYTMTLQNFNTLLNSTQNTDSLQTIDFIEGTPDSKKSKSKQAVFEKWSEESIKKELEKEEDESEEEEKKSEEEEEKEVSKVSVNDFPSIRTEEPPKRVQFVEIIEAPKSRPNSSFNDRSVKINAEKNISEGGSTPPKANLPNSDTKPRQRPSTTAGNYHHRKKLSFKDNLMQKFAVKSHLFLEGKKAQMDTLAGPYYIRNSLPATTKEGIKTLYRQIEPLILSPKSDDKSAGSLSPGNWILKGKVLPKSMQNLDEKKDEIYQRKGHIPLVRIKSNTTRKINLGSWIKRSKTDEGPQVNINKLRTEHSTGGDESINAWASEEYGLPSFGLKRANSRLEVEMDDDEVIES